MNCYDLLSKSKFPRLLLIGLRILIGIGCLTKTSEVGIICYTCLYEPDVSKDTSCIEPVKLKAKTSNIVSINNLDLDICFKSTLTRTMTGTGGSEIKDLLRDNSKRSKAEAEGATLEYKCTNPIQFYSYYKNESRCYCTTDLCNFQPGIDTTDLELTSNTTKPEEGDDSGSSKNFHVFSAKMVLLSLLPLRVFLHLM